MSVPKQTETTQRRKLTRRITESGAEVPTKIEFSRRGLDREKAVEPVDVGVIRTYRLYPVIVQPGKILRRHRQLDLRKAVAQYPASMLALSRIQTVFGRIL
jgi:hypothetical protein